MTQFGTADALFAIMRWWAALLTLVMLVPGSVTAQVSGPILPADIDPGDPVFSGAADWSCRGSGGRIAAQEAFENEAADGGPMLAWSVGIGVAVGSLIDLANGSDRTVYQR